MCRGAIVAKFQCLVALLDRDAFDAITPIKDGSADGGYLCWNSKFRHSVTAGKDKVADSGGSFSDFDSFQTRASQKGIVAN